MQKGVGGRGERLRPFQAPAALWNRHRFGTRNGFQEATLNEGSRILGLTAKEDAGGFDRTIGHGQRTHRVGQLLGCGSDGSNEGGKRVSGAAPIQQAAVPEGRCEVKIREI